MRGRLVLNGTTEVRGSLGEISATHVSLATAIWLQTMVPLTAGDTVELQGYFRVADGYFAADHTSFWGNKIGRPHTVPCKVTGKCGSVWLRLIPAPRGTGIVSAPVPKKLLQMAGIDDCYTSARGSTGTSATSPRRPTPPWPPLTPT